jgi:hypothetical protein
LAPPESKIINADDGEFIILVGNTAANHPQQCVIAHWYHQTIGKGRRRSATERQTKMVNNGLQPLGAPTVTCEHATIELFAEDTPTAQNGIAPEPTRHDRQLNSTTAKRQVSGPTQISALNSSALSTTGWTRSGEGARSQPNLHTLFDNRHIINCKTGRSEARPLKSLLHS